MDGNSPGKAERELGEFTDVFFVDFFCDRIGCVTYVFPFHGGDINHTVISRTFDGDDILPECPDDTDFPVVESSGCLGIVLDQHYFGSNFQV
ncbi:hypothetical protein SDC9_42611 [bioreactor metagenome]|uniref:Uncharacterized protein n=1 Tax=bioreactor metagenome TaxID=1076179 RepID=A0A644VYD6_9ZZZZ